MLPMFFVLATKEVEAPSNSKAFMVSCRSLEPVSDLPTIGIFEGDLSLGRGRVGLLQRSPDLWPSAMPSVAWKLATATAILKPHADSEAYRLTHQVWYLGLKM